MFAHQLPSKTDLGRVLGARLDRILFLSLFKIEKWSELENLTVHEFFKSY